MKEGYEFVSDREVEILIQNYQDNGYKFLLPTEQQLKEIKPFFHKSYHIVDWTPGCGKYLAVDMGVGIEGNPKHLMTLLCLDDEWFIAYISLLGLHKTQIGMAHGNRVQLSKRYKCDQFDGLMNCLRDNIPLHK